MKRRANERQMERALRAEETLWCSWGRHMVIPSAVAKEHFSRGTMCLRHQIEIMESLENVVQMPELSEALRLRKRKQWDIKRARAVATAPLKSADPTADGVVYYMRINGRIKVGFTTDLTKRSRAYPPDTELLAVEPGGKSLERRRHEQFSRYLDRGREWFVEGPGLVEHIRSLSETYPVPTELMHKYTKHRGTNA